MDRVAHLRGSLRRRPRRRATPPRVLPEGLIGNDPPDQRGASRKTSGWATMAPMSTRALPPRPLVLFHVRVPVALSGPCLLMILGALASCQRGAPPPRPSQGTPQTEPATPAPTPRATPKPKDPMTTQHPAGEAKDGLRLRLEARRTNYDASEPLELMAYLENMRNSPITVMRRASHVDLGLDAFNAAGEFITSLLPPAPPMPPTREDLAVMEPGASLLLGDWELLSRVNQQIMAGHGRKGRFSVKAAYHAGSGLTAELKALDPTVWTGSLTSNTVEIEVR